MSREAHIPLALWICAAIVAHMAGGGGAVEVAQVIEDRAQLRQMVHAVREGLRPGDMTFEVLTDGVAPTPPPTPLAPPERPSDAAAESEPDRTTPPDPPKPEPVKVAKAPPPKPAPTREKAPPPPPPKPEPPKEEVAKVVPVQPAPPPLPPADRRIAVRQHVQKDQEDNPEANRIADDANKVAEETMAQIRSKDQDDPAPTPGTPSGPMGPKDKVGDSDHDHSGHSEERAGNEKHAPGEKNPESESAEHHSPASPAQAPARSAPPPSVPGASGGGRVAQAPPAMPAPEKGAAGGSGPASPEVVDSAQGGYTLNPANPGGDGKSRVAGKKATPQPYQSPVRVGSIGLGAPGIPGGPNLNLNMAGVQAAVGNEKLRAERASDGASRKSAHRGSWETTDKWKKWRAAIENYDPSVKPGNQTSLNAARVPFATYINMIHNRLHPIFAEEFLASLESLPAGHAFNQNRVTHLEIVLNKDNGSIVRLGVTRPSGMTAFDIVALSSVHRASPFGKAPDAIVSPDGNVYLHWEFHRDPYDACSTRNARPFLLKTPSEGAPVEPAPVRRAPRPVPGDEKTMTPSGPLLPLRR